MNIALYSVSLNFKAIFFLISPYIPIWVKDVKVLHHVSIRILEDCVEPKVEGDVFGQVNLASLTIRCAKLRKLPTLETNSRGEIRDLFDGKEMMHIHLDTKDILLGEAFLLRIQTFDDSGLAMRYPCTIGLKRLILQLSKLGSDHYERIGVF